MGPWEHLEWHGVTRSDTGAPKVFFSAKMTKMPLDNPRFDWRSNDVKTTFFIVLHQTLAFLEIFNNLTKFDLKFISSGPQTLILISCQNELKLMPLWILSNSHSNDYSWVKIGVKTTEISLEPI